MESHPWTIAGPMGIRGLPWISLAINLETKGQSGHFVCSRRLTTSDVVHMSWLGRHLSSRKQQEEPYTFAKA